MRHASFVAWLLVMLLADPAGSDCRVLLEPSLALDDLCTTMELPMLQELFDTSAEVVASSAIEQDGGRCKIVRNWDVGRFDCFFVVSD
jgi:hypothetical protein